MRAVNRLPGVFVFPAGTGSFHVGSRFVKMGMQGVSDLIGWKSVTAFPESPVARFVALEIKVGRDKLAPLQKAFLDQVTAAGGIGLEIRRIEEAIKALS